MTCRHPILCFILCFAGSACQKTEVPSPGQAPAVLSSLPPRAAAPVVARLERSAGDVRLQPAGQMVAHASRTGATFAAGDVVITGADGEATVVFDGRNEVTLAPNSTLLIRPTGGGADQTMGAVVLRGSARAASGGKGTRMRIGTPVGTAEVGGAQVSVLEVSIDKGLKVQVGEVSLSQTGAQTGAPRVMTSGQSVAIEGLAIGQQATTIDGLAIHRQSTTIDGLAIPRQDTTVDGLTLSQQTTTVDGLTVPQQATTVDGLTVPQQATTVDGLTVPQQGATTVDGLTVPKQGTTTVDGLTVPQQATTVDGLSVANQGTTTVDGLTVPQQATTVDGLAIPGMPAVPAIAAAGGDDVADAAEAVPAPGAAGTGRGLGSVFVTASPRGAEVQASPKSPLRPVLQRTAVFAGGQVRVAQAGRAQVRMGRDAQLSLAPNTRFVLSRLATPKRHLSYGMDAGAGQLILRPEPGQRLAHDVELAHTVAEIASSVYGASADLSIKDDQGLIYLRYGRARIGQGAAIEAGQVFGVQGGKVVGAPHPIDAPITLQPGKTVEVYSAGRALPIAFAAAQPAANGKLLVELARDRQFRQILAAEEVSRPSFGLDVLPATRLFYRINKDPASVGSVALLGENDAACPECRHANIVQDTGKKTVMYYQETLPAIDVRWQPVPNATHYHLRIFRDGVFDRAEVDETLTTTAKSLPRGRLGEGHYYWLVTATNQAGRDLSEPRTNVLQITYDNVIEKMSIKAPQMGAKVAQDSIQTTGYVVLGSKLYINGNAIELNKQGHFDETVPLKAGVNTLVYRTVNSDGTERYYSRDVTRTKS